MHPFRARLPAHLPAFARGAIGAGQIFIVRRTSEQGAGKGPRPEVGIPPPGVAVIRVDAGGVGGGLAGRKARCCSGRDAGAQHGVQGRRRPVRPIVAEDAVAQKAIMLSNIAPEIPEEHIFNAILPTVRRGLTTLHLRHC